MAELQQLRVQEAVDSMVKSLERENIRKMQVSGPRPSRGAANVKDQRRGLPASPMARSCPLLLRPTSLHTARVSTLFSEPRNASVCRSCFSRGVCVSQIVPLESLIRSHVPVQRQLL
ncbi:FAM136A isoform 4 [Pongo abelii]|uniref:FAM136A isoform 4 n=1 Tax=Pongo abelii TaxID=9601 RepID=A0A2J8XBV3_PONAB|nr:FAM136A isoform 4 [Pongo abelii]